MEKYLKKFIKIKDDLNSKKERKIRIEFIINYWKEKMEYSDKKMEMEVKWEKMVNELLLNVKDVKRCK